MAVDAWRTGMAAHGQSDPPFSRCEGETVKPMTKTEKMALLEIVRCSSMSTADWRRFSPLARRGLVEIDGEDSGPMRSMWGSSYRSIRATKDGHREADRVARDDVKLWHRVA